MGSSQSTSVSAPLGSEPSPEPAHLLPLLRLRARHDGGSVGGFGRVSLTSGSLVDVLFKRGKSLSPLTPCPSGTPNESQYLDSATVDHLYTNLRTRKTETGGGPPGSAKERRGDEGIGGFRPTKIRSHNRTFPKPRGPPGPSPFVLGSA